ncbi:MAG: dipeptidase [Nocardioides sp.]|uniref:M15 family metallopeptidase n=1 Tax=Nocardioides sp. TaxID=35761 RepID=UPI002393AD4B|nr:M15 family metallopeptidase [Nocardioides sp.]MDE0775197.1 dipeptidase [Nocardioides sp.]
MSGSATTGGWGDVVLICDDAVTGIDVVEQGDPLVDSTGTLPWSGPSSDPVSRWVRAPLLERLGDAAAALPSDLRLALNEGYRRPSLQRHYFDGYAARLREQRPDADAAEIHRLASRYISPPALAPHTAGAAADVVLTDPDGVLLDLGCPIDANPEESEGRCYTAHPDVRGEAALLRRTLVAALTDVGLVNYPTEWWHWSYGDRYWALGSGAPYAIYEACEPPAG